MTARSDRVIAVCHPVRYRCGLDSDGDGDGDGTVMRDVSVSQRLRFGVVGAEEGWRRVGGGLEDRVGTSTTLQVNARGRRSAEEGELELGNHVRAGTESCTGFGG